MSTHEALLTPATYVGSDDGMRSSPEASARNRGRWKGGLRGHSSASPQLVNSKGVGNGPHKVFKTKSKPNVIKRAIHKIGKKTKKSSSGTPPSSSSAGVDTTPPKIEELGIEPRLLEKWKERKELKKQAAGAGGKPATSRGTATLVVVGLSSGSLAWTKDRLRQWSQANGLVLAACIIAAAVAIAFTMARKYLIGGNWKCNGTTESVAALVKVLNEGGDFPSNAEVVVAPPSIFLQTVKDSIRADIKVSTQNVAKSAKPGAFTGELCAPMIKDFGVEWVITGHSERRTGFGAAGESSELVAEKTKTALDCGMNVIACIGESLEVREANKTLELVLDDHMASFLKVLDEADWSRVVIAYEPVWAIGTGVTASPAQAQEVHSAIRAWIGEKVSPAVAESLRIIYGGSVKGANAGELATCPDIDGFLVGGASLKPEFVDIIKAVDGK
eukprot:g10090.t1